MRELVALLAFTFALLCMLLFAGMYVDNHAVPSAYIIRTDRMRTFEGDELWTLEYSMRGAVQQAAFDSPEDRDRYVEHLERLGKEGGDD
jgi:hypothetical protein